VTSDGKSHSQLVDSGCDRELCGLAYARRHGFKSRRLKQVVNIEYMDGKWGTPITHATWQKQRIQTENGWREFTIKYLLADIPEGMVLGRSWLGYANPDIDWATGKLRWRSMRKVLRARQINTVQARKARQQIIQGAIQYNEAPDWVKHEFPDVLAPQPKGLPPSRPGFDYVVNLKPGFVAKRQPNRSFSPGERKMFAELEKCEVEAQRWELSQSEQAVQMLWAAKAGGEKRPCIDYRPINAWMVDNAFPIPVIKDLMTDIAGCTHISSLDLPKAYWSIRIADNRSKDLLSFYCNNALYRPTVMQFGSKTAVAHFQRFITHTLRGLIGRGVHAYLDNIVVYANSQAEHDRLLRATLAALRKEKISIQPKKCEWSKTEVQFCGFLVSKDGVRLDPEKVRAIQEWQPPPKEGGARAKTKVREFLGFCNFYRDHIERYSEIAVPLTRLTGLKTEWSWGPKEKASWQMLKTAVLSAPVLAAYDEKLPIEVWTDACDSAIAGIIHHRYANGTKKPLAFYSKKLDKAEQNYTVHDKELLAIVKTFHHFRSWLHGSPEPIKVWSDHKALQHFLTTTNLTQRHARWAEKLAEFRFQIHHTPGRANAAADALSRKDDNGLGSGGGVAPLSIEHFA
jgi:hypothetical protein